MYDRSSGTFGNSQITAGSFRKTGQEVFEIAQNQWSLEPGAKPLPGIRAVPQGSRRQSRGWDKKKRSQTTGFHVYNRGVLTLVRKSQITTGSLMKTGRVSEVI
jgi:hypothetical protein